MAQVNMHEAKTQLSRLVERALNGEDVVIARAGKPLVRMVPVNKGRKRPLGLLRLKVPDTVFFDPLPDDELDAWSQ
jgi:prevent-host-death family protein